MTRTAVLFPLLLSLLAAACGGTSVTDVSGPSAVPGGSANRCETALGSPLPTVSAEGGRLEVAIVAARECEWTASVDAAWAQVAPASGQGEATVMVTVTPNPQATARSTSIAVNGQRTTLAQAPAPCRFTLGSTVTQQPAGGGSASVQVTATSGCAWVAASPVSWVSVNPASGQGGLTVTVRVDANTGAARTTQITIAGEPFTVEQDAFVAAAPAPPAPEPAPAPAPAPAPPPPAPAPSPAPPKPTDPPPPPPPAPPPSSCSYSIDPQIRSVDHRRRDGEIDVLTTSGCAWTARSNAGWIDIRSGGSGTGSGEVRYRVEENDSLLPRIGTITVAGHVFTVLQGGRNGRDDDDD